MSTKWCQKFGLLRMLWLAQSAEPKLRRESMTYYQDKSNCPKIPNLLIRGDAKSDSREMG